MIRQYIHFFSGRFLLGTVYPGRFLQPRYEVWTRTTSYTGLNEKARSSVQRRLTRGEASRLRRRHPDDKRSSFALFAFHFDGAVVFFDQLRGNHQTEACSFLFQGAKASVVTLKCEEALLHVGGHADSGVTDGDAYFAATYDGLDFYFAGRRGEFNGVTQNISDYRC